MGCSSLGTDLKVKQRFSYWPTTITKGISKLEELACCLSNFVVVVFDVIIVVTIVL